MTPDELANLEQAVGLTDEDRRYLRLAGDVLEDQAETVVDCWRGIIAQQPHLSFYSLGPDSEPYKVAVKRRFVQWVAAWATGALRQARRRRCGNEYQGNRRMAFIRERWT